MFFFGIFDYVFTEDTAEGCLGWREVYQISGPEFTRWVLIKLDGTAYYQSIPQNNRIHYKAVKNIET